MTKTRIIIAFVAMLIGHPSHAEPRYIVALNDAPPYRIIDDAGEASGIYVDIFRIATERLGLTTEYVVVPYLRAFKMMKDGQCDVMLGPNYSQERARYMEFLEPSLPREDKLIFIRNDAKDIASYDDLTGLLIAVLRGAAYSNHFDNDGALKKIVVDSYVNAFDMLEIGRVDAAIVPAQQGRWLLRRGDRRLKAASFSLPGDPSHIAIARTSRLLDHRADIEATLRSMQADGSVSEILDRYH
jgi:polar amino acid transport system substrate-binding protein